MQTFERVSLGIFSKEHRHSLNLRELPHLCVMPREPAKESGSNNLLDGKIGGCSSSS